METQRDKALNASREAIEELSTIYEQHIRPALEQYTATVGFVVDDVHFVIGRAQSIGVSDQYYLNKVNLALETHSV